ncbi:MAG: hypothetical protein U0L98_05245 [Clostridia bacterium]|nr:hypothetical protein [Clostridia bacterium]
MSLIKCPECNQDISSLADSCAHCGYPIRIEDRIDITTIKKIAKEYEENCNLAISTAKEDWEYRTLSKEYLSYDNSFRFAYACYYISKIKNIVISNPDDSNWHNIDYSWIKDNIDSIEKITKEDFKFLISYTPKYVEKTNTEHFSQEQIENEIEKETIEIYKTKERFYSKCQKYQQKRTERLKESRDFLDSMRKSRTNTQAKCPHCGSSNYKKISMSGRVVSTGLFGLASSTIGKTYTCNSCGYKW